MRMLIFFGQCSAYTLKSDAGLLGSGMDSVPFHFSTFKCRHNYPLFMTCLCLCGPAVFLPHLFALRSDTGAGSLPWCTEEHEW